MSASTLKEYFENNRNQAATISTDELRQELENREIKTVFPLDVFHLKIKPFIQVLNKEFDLPRAYVGLGMLIAYSSAIGTSYAIKSGTDYMYLPVWGCFEGISSSGKSLAMSMIMRPLLKIQKEFDKEWNENTQEMKLDEKRYEILKTAIYRDVHIATLTRYVLPDNPKGLTKIADEILEWINGMNQLSRKEGTDEQFWLSTWDCAPYSGIRSGKEKFSLPRPFVNVVGGIQPSITYKLFAKDRDVTGLIFRLLFAVPETVKIAEPNSMFQMDSALEELHAKCINMMYKNLVVKDDYQEPKICTFEPEAQRAIEQWRKMRIARINHMDDVKEKEIHAGILGKIYTYAKRFSALLCISDRAYDGGYLNDHMVITESMAQRALKLADYFYESAAVVSDRVNTKVTAPAHILRWAGMLRAGLSFAKMGKMEFPDCISDDAAAKKMSREIKKAIKEYPTVFGAVEKR